MELVIMQEIVRIQEDDRGEEKGHFPSCGQHSRCHAARLRTVFPERLQYREHHGWGDRRSEGDDDVLEQITKQLRKLVDVVDLKVLDPDNSVTRELVLVKIRVRPEQRQSVVTLSDVFRGKIVDVGQDSLIVELTGNHDKLEAFLRLLSGYEILELARTGFTGLSRGSDDVRFF